MITGLLSIALQLAAQSGPPHRPAQTWDTCYTVDGKGQEGCDTGDPERPFAEFLADGAWVNEPKGRFGGDVLSYLHSDASSLRAEWRDLGRFGKSNAREIRYSVRGAEDALVLVVEKRPGMFAPLFKWSGGLRGIPRGGVWRAGAVLAIEANYSGSFQMYKTWAWAWSERGPVLLDPQEALSKAVATVLPGYGAYPTGMNWKDLSMWTGAWKGEWPGKIGVQVQMNAWFELRGTKLVLKRAEVQDDEGKVRRWP
ncbi:MAG: hypothetical protein U0Q16_10310 [Bryobacteraceae bacterium]